MLENFQLIQNKRPCKVRTIWASLSDADKEIFLSNVNDLNIPAKALERSFKAVGLDLGDTAIHAHRKSFCSCSRI